MVRFEGQVMVNPGRGDGQVMVTPGTLLSPLPARVVAFATTPRLVDVYQLCGCASTPSSS
jgi:hypothetical protein